LLQNLNRGNIYKRKHTFIVSAYYLAHHDEQSTNARVYTSFYARKQLLLSARLSHRNSVSVCPPSDGWISQKRCKLGSPNLHLRLPGRL